MATQLNDGPARPLFTVSRSWIIVFWAAVAMALLALVGVALSTTSNAVAAVYWVALVPVYAAFCISIAWTRAHYEGVPHRPEVIRQLLHWLGIGVAIALDFLVRGSGEEAGTAAGLNALLLLALGCYLAGIHLEWIFVFVGVLLAGALIVLAKAQQYLWLILAVGVVAGLAMLGVRWLLGRQPLAASPHWQEGDQKESRPQPKVTVVRVRGPQREP